jgi:hypothetical protein
MNTRHFEETKEQIQQIWQFQPKGATFVTKMHKVIRLYKGFCKDKAIQFWKEEVVLKHKLEITKLDLQKLVQNKLK